MNVLTINSGSATIKFSLYNQEKTELLPLYKADADKSIQPCFLQITDAAQKTYSLPFPENSIDNFYSVAITLFIDWLKTKEIKIQVVSHRVVHGGTKFSQPILITAPILQQLIELCPLAPLHQPFNIQGIQQAQKLLPDCPQIACFDTAFHRTNPEINQLYAIPQQWAEKGVRRYGFHGLSYAYIQQQLVKLAPEIAHKKVIIAHLGQGASLCALAEGKSVLTSMGLSALDGLVMGTRCGCLDPGVILYWLQECQYSAAEITDILYRKSGLLGVSGISSDMRTLLASPQPTAQLAIDMFVQRISQQMGLLAAELQGLDAIVFTAGIGERAVSIRAAVIERLQWLGFSLDAAANTQNALLISTPQSKIKAYVIPTNEEYMLATYAMSAII
jgi:acetate kinase